MKISSPSAPLLQLMHRVMLAAGIAIAVATPVYAKNDKVSDDLANISADSGKSKKNTWLNTAGPITYAKVVIVASSSDPDPATDLRRAVLTAGGSVYYRYLSISGLLAVVPVNQINALTQRADVVSISADRVTTKTLDFSHRCSRSHRSAARASSMARVSTGPASASPSSTRA